MENISETIKSIVEECKKENLKGKVKMLIKMGYEYNSVHDWFANYDAPGQRKYINNREVASMAKGQIRKFLKNYK